MTMEQVVTGQLTVWPPNRTATRDLNEDFARMVFSIEMVDIVSGGINCLILSAITPTSREVFNWDAAEKRADWEEHQVHFVEFTNVKYLLSNLHS